MSLHSNQSVVYECLYCGYLTNKQEVFKLHQLLKIKYGECRLPERRNGKA